MNKIVLGTLMAAVVATPTLAQLPTQKVLPMKLALEAASAAACLKDGMRVAATVVDTAGQIRVQLRADGAGFHTLESSNRKALTSATLRAPTAVIGERFNSDPVTGGLRFISGFMPVGGGLPIMVGTELVGAIGVGGAPSGDKDQACSQAGIDKIKDSLK
jgi:uncharacterized protein GlcG (DUF336 family)